MEFKYYTKKRRKRLYFKFFSVCLEALAVVLVLYLIALPFYSNIKYKLFYNDKISETEARAAIEEQLKMIREEIKISQEETEIETQEASGGYKNSLPENKYDVSPNRVIIPKIGVNAPIVVTDNSAYGLSQGSWLVPDTSTPDQGGNTVLTGHRFKYLPPNNLTFYLFDKLEVGDLVSVVWKEKDYLYRVKETKIVEATDLSIQDPTDEPTLTMFTCHPIYSTDQRLVIVSELLENDIN
jgi:LPXTG-site transpeptidase (sortase) family protein